VNKLLFVLALLFGFAVGFTYNGYRTEVAMSEAPPAPPPPEFDSGEREMLWQYYFKCEVCAVYHLAVTNEEGLAEEYRSIQKFIEQVIKDGQEPTIMLLDSIYMDLWRLEKKEPEPDLMRLRAVQAQVEEYVREKWNKLL
jgi:hypothetical protein